MHRAIGESHSQRGPIVGELPRIHRSQSPPREAGRQPGRAIDDKLGWLKAAPQPQAKPNFLYGSRRIGECDVNRATLGQPAACADGEEHLLRLKFLKFEHARRPGPVDRPAGCPVVARDEFAPQLELLQEFAVGRVGERVRPMKPLELGDPLDKNAPCLLLKLDTRPPHGFSQGRRPVRLFARPPTKFAAERPKRRRPVQSSGRRDMRRTLPRHEETFRRFLGAVEGARTKVSEWIFPRFNRFSRATSCSTRPKSRCQGHVDSIKRADGRCLSVLSAQSLRCQGRRAIRRIEKP